MDVFVLISGYFMATQASDDNIWKKTLSKALKLWLQIVFYSIAIYVVCNIINGNVFSMRNFIHYVLPVRFDIYWFMTCYMMLLMVSPFLSKIVSVLGRKEYNWLLIILTFGGVILQLPQVNKGHSFLWFVSLFFIGGYIKKFDALLTWQDKAGRYFIASYVVLAAICITRSLLNGRLNSMHYLGTCNGLLTILMSVFFFLYFKNLKLKENSLVRGIVMIAPYSLGVYLIHEHPLVRGILWRSVEGIWPYSDFWLIPCILLSCAAVYLLCTLIEYLRQILFSLLSVDILAENALLSVLKRSKSFINKSIC